VPNTCLCGGESWLKRGCAASDADDVFASCGAGAAAGQGVERVVEGDLVIGDGSDQSAAARRPTSFKAPILIERPAGTFAIAPKAPRPGTTVYSAQVP
jgi:hypothetical protein